MTDEPDKDAAARQSQWGAVLTNCPGCGAPHWYGPNIPAMRYKYCLTCRLAYAAARRPTEG